MIVHEFRLDMVPNCGREEVWLNQYDDDFLLRIHLYASQGTFEVESGTSASVRGTKPDGTGFSANATLAQNEDETWMVDVAGDQQITAACGRCVFELTLTRNGKELNTANFIVHVERAALDRDTIPSDSKLKEFVEVYDRADEIIAAGAAYEAAEAAMRETAAETAASAQTASEAASGAATTYQNYQAQYAQDYAALTSYTEESLAAIETKRQAIQNIATNADTIAQQALSAASNAENASAQSAADIQALIRELNMTNATVDTKVDDAYVESGYLYLTSNGDVVAGPLGPFSGGGGGGGGEGGNNAKLTVTNTTGWLSHTIAAGDSCPITLNWTSIEDEIPTGDGTAKITVNGAAKGSLNIHQGNITIDIGPYCSVGANTVRVTISDVYNNSRSINYSINSVAVSISSTFEASTPYTGAILFPYTPVGAVSKTIHFILDGTQIGTQETTVSGRQMTYTIPQQTHGPHTFEVYFDCDINGQTVESNHLRYEIICIEAGNTTPIIVSAWQAASVTQYTTLHIPYTVYDPTSLTAATTITVNGTVVSTITVDRTQQDFAYQALDIGTLTIVIASGTASKTLSTTVEESDIHVEPETQSLALYLNAKGRSNSEAHPEIWQDTDAGVSATLTGFNFTSDGWVADDDGTTVLRLSGDARATIPFNIFENDFRTTGKTIEVEFATHGVLNYDSVIMSCMSGGRGMEFTAQQAMLASEQSHINMQYKEDEHVRISFVVEKRTENRLIYVYVNGVMSGVVQYPANDDFSQAEPVGISIGSSTCGVDIYCIRVYDNDLGRIQVLNNWIADTQIIDDMLERYTRNNVYDEYGNIVISKLPSELPYMIITCPELPQYKGDKKAVEVSYVDPVTPAKSFTATGVQADVQGTSSQYYARKNYKMKFKSGFVLANGTQSPTYQLRPGYIGTSTFTFKADVASSEGANNVELVRLYEDACPYKTPAQEENSAVRQGIDGFPIVIFWNNGDETTFLGKIA